MDTQAVNLSSNNLSVEAIAKKARETREASAERSNEIAQERRQQAEARNAEAVAERKARIEQQKSDNHIDTYA
jgi:hypothetical protein